MFQDHKDLLSAFNARGVRYLIVGGYAVVFHAQPRFTKDIDLFIKADPTNAQATYAALAAFGAPVGDLDPQDFANPENFFRFGQDPVGVDVLPQISGIDFDDAWNRRVEGVIDEETGLKAFFISKEDLIAAKLATGRLRDLGDVEALRAATGASPKRPASQAGTIVEKVTRNDAASRQEIADRVEHQIQQIADRRVVGKILPLLVTPYPVERSWDYGEPDQKFTCWTVLEHAESNSGIAFCSEGFGPSYPWGLVSLSGPHMGIGTDCGWYVSLEQAFRESMAWDEENPDGYEVD